MRPHLITLAIIAAVTPLSPALARVTTGFTVRPTVMHAGPAYSYPAVQRLRRSTRLTIFGCLRDWTWCDVGNRYDRGWVPQRDLAANYRGRRSSITWNIGILVLPFTFGSYWDTHYRTRPFYPQRSRWIHQDRSMPAPSLNPPPRRLDPASQAGPQPRGNPRIIGTVPTPSPVVPAHRPGRQGKQVSPDATPPQLPATAPAQVQTPQSNRDHNAPVDAPRNGAPDHKRKPHD